MNTSNKDAPIALGLTANEWVQKLNTNKAARAQKALNYFDGEQECEVEKVLDDPQKGTRNWRDQGFIPRYRNLTKMVVEKSGLLFKDCPPDLEVMATNANDPDQPQTERLMMELDKVEWQSTFSQFDQIIRLLKTGAMLIQYDQVNDCATFDILHRGNCDVVIDPSTKQPAGLIYKTSCEEDGLQQYRVITNDAYIDLKDQQNGKAIVLMTQPNPLGFVPVCAFYDTASPRTGWWMEPQMDLINMNEMYNLHLTESAFSMSWAKLPTLYTNMQMNEPGSDGQSFDYDYMPNGKLPSRRPATPVVMTGPSTVVVMDGSAVTAPFVEYLAPVAEYDKFDAVIDGWVRSFAADWSVNIRAAGEARAASGFQLLVEEIDNTELRQQRRRAFEQGFKQFWRVFGRVINTVHPGTFNVDGFQLWACFSDPKLPVEDLAEEQVWSLKISEGRATDIDYLKATQGLSDDEAWAAFVEIQEFQFKKAKLLAQLAAGVVPPAGYTMNADGTLVAETEPTESAQQEAEVTDSTNPNANALQGNVPSVIIPFNQILGGL